MPPLDQLVGERDGMARRASIVCSIKPRGNAGGTSSLGSTSNMDVLDNAEEQAGIGVEDRQGRVVAPAEDVGGEIVYADDLAFARCEPGDAIDRHGRLAQLLQHWSGNVMLTRYSLATVTGMPEIAAMLAMLRFRRAWLKVR
jgi:hypothetical protein